MNMLRHRPGPWIMAAARDYLLFMVRLRRCDQFAPPLRHTGRGLPILCALPAGMVVYLVSQVIPDHHKQRVMLSHLCSLCCICLWFCAGRRAAIGFGFRQRLHIRKQYLAVFGG